MDFNDGLKNLSELEYYFHCEKNDHYLSNFSNMRYFDLGNSFKKENIETVLKNNNILDIRSDQDKFLIYYNLGPHHIMRDMFFYILIFIKNKPNSKIYIDMSHSPITHSEVSYYENTFDYIFYNFLHTFFKENNIDFEFITGYKFDYVVTNNTYYMNFKEGGDRDFAGSEPLLLKNLFNKYLIKYVKNISLKPYKKIYLKNNKPDNNIKINDNFNVRIYNEEVLEKYLKDLGFEIIYPPEKFTTFEDQINLFYETKTLISVSGSALANSFLMQNNTKLIELVSPIVIKSPSDGKAAFVFHNFWSSIQPLNNSLYVALPNVSRNPEKLINFLESNQSIKNLLKE